MAVVKVGYVSGSGEVSAVLAMVAIERGDGIR